MSKLVVGTQSDLVHLLHTLRDVREHTTCILPGLLDETLITTLYKRISAFLCALELRKSAGTTAPTMCHMAPVQVCSNKVFFYTLRTI